MARGKATQKTAADECRLVANHAPVCLAHIDREARFLFINRTWAGLLGLEPDRIVGQPVAEVVGDGAYSRLAPHLQTALNGDDVTFESEIPFPSIGPRFVHVSCVPQRDAGGNVSGLLAAITDITGRRSVEEALRQSEVWLKGQKEAFQAAIGGAPLLDSLDILVRAAIEQMGGQARCAFHVVDTNGETLRHVIGMPENYARYVDGFKIGPESLACGLAAHTRKPRITPDVREDPLWKRWLWLAEKFDYRGCWSFPVETSPGKVVGTFALYFREPRGPTPRDLELAAVLTHAAGMLISRNREAEERARAESVLRANEQRFRAFMDATSDVVYRMSADWSEMSYLRGKEFIADTTDPNRTWLDKYVRPEDQEGVMNVIRHAIRNKSVFELEHRVVRADGSTGWAFARAIPTLDEQGNVLEWFGAARDITRQKEDEEKLRQMQKLESLGVLAGGIAHDFNNLLTGMLGNASLLVDSLEGARQRELAEALVEASERMATLTQQMLAYSGKGRFLVERLSLSDEVGRIESLIHASVPKHVELRLDLARDLPMIEADSGQMQQVVMNLLINAAEAIGPEGGCVEVATSVRDLRVGRLDGNLLPEDAEAGSYVALTVKDNGAGMDEETKSRIFDPFFTTKFTGRGLGLSAVLGVVRGHKGLLTVTSAPRCGTTFEVLFPVSRHQQAPSPAATAAPRRSKRADTAS